MGTRKSVDQILDKAADIIEKDGWITERCYDSATGGYCALGAIARAVYPKATGKQIGDLAYVVDAYDGAYKDRNGHQQDPRHLEAVVTLAQHVTRCKHLVEDADTLVYSFNDDGRVKSSKRIVAALRKAAEKYRSAAS
jgi:hypothetical protein